MSAHYEVLLRPLVYFAAVIVFWQTAKRKSAAGWYFVGIAAALFVASMSLSLVEATVRHDEVIDIAGSTLPYIMVKVLLENVGLFAIVISLLILLTRRLRVATKEVRRLAQIAASSADAIVGFDGAGVINTWNRGAEMVFGFLPDEMIGRKIDTLVSEESRPALDAARDRCPAAGFVKDLSLRMIAKTRSDVLADVTVSPVYDEDGVAIATSLFIRDVSDKAELEGDVLQACKTAAMSTVAAGFVQEFGNLLAAMSSRARSALCADSLDAARAEVTEIANCADRARGINDNLIAYSKRQEPVKSMSQLADAADAAVAILERDLDHARIAVNRRYESVPGTAFDRDQIVHVFVNVIRNAIDAMRGSGGVVEIGISRRHGYLEASIRDNGPGISREVMSRVFEPFAEQGESGGPKAGLGLFVCRQMIEFHNGNITIESRPGEGTTVRFFLPITTLGETAGPRPSARPADAPACCVAIVDKDTMIRELLAQVVRRNGLATETFEDAAAARAGKVGERFGAVFVDVSLLTAEGARYVEELKGDPRRVVIGMVAEASDKDQMREIEQGLFQLLRKPFGLEEIGAICQALTSGDDGAGKRAA